MLDPNAVMQQIQVGTPPPTWRVLRAKPGYFISNAIIFGIFGVGALAVVAYLFFGDHYYYFIVPPTDARGEKIWLIIDIVAVTIVAVGAFAFAITRLVGLGTAQMQMLVLTPEGFLVAMPNGVKTFSFTNINGMTAATMRDGDVRLTMRRAADGKQIVYDLDGRFGAPKTIASSLLAAQGQYATARATSSQTAGG